MFQHKTIKKMRLQTRITVALASLALIATYFLPVWQIDLVAPQYPEGLSMQIWLNKLSGQVEIINGLNHYIGMKHIEASMFPEFGYLVYIIGAFILLGVLVAALGNRRILFGYIILLFAGGVAAMVDFYQWGYDYGHNLDPTAAIQVPGLSYQPPVIGHKQLLNFDAYSFPASGGWIIVVSGLLFIAAWLFEYLHSRKSKKTGKPVHVRKRASAIAAIMFLTIGLSSCQSGPQPFVFGKDACHFCKMTIMSPQFGGELVTKKGRVYKFDDLHCLIAFMKTGEVKQENIAQTLTIDYTKQNNFLDATTASYVKSENLHSPMNSNTASFATQQEAKTTAAQFRGNIIDWQTLVSGTKE
jgi:copper chaperone NosL